MQLRLGSRILDLSTPKVMGVLNVTPDSFSDGGRFPGVDAALAQAERMAGEGAAIVDVGGESSRPGAAPVPVQAELDRVIPVIEAIRARIDVAVSIDTSKPEVMRAAAAAGAAMINDIFALRAEGALAEAARHDLAVCLMHMQGEPRTMQENPEYGDVTEEVAGFLADRVAACAAAGVARERITVDPGFGFGKTAAHNLTLLAGLGRLLRLELPLTVGLSRKSTLGALTGRPVDDRMPAGIAAAVLAVERGAHIVRTHDVGPTIDALVIAGAVLQNRTSHDP
ncbi:MAG TPA: dihydropteroate synthase [Woeseiaceae bacterium]|nr:dihydropteroate synthase [Woeseiaceae bacterium]